MIVDRATILEWPQIEALARTYFERMGRDYQDRRESGTWYVARRGERVEGCYATQVFHEHRQVWTTDLYAAEGFAGKRAALLLSRHAYAEAAAIGYDVVLNVDPANKEWVTLVERYSDAELVALVYLHKSS